MNRISMLLFLCFLFLGCKNVIRDIEVYSAEIGFIEAASAEQIRRGTAVIDRHCKCEEIDGEMFFTTDECSNLAETILVVRNRMQYHLDFMKFLGGLIEDRPSEYPPEVPDISVMCPQRLSIEDIPESYKNDMDGGLEE